MNKKALYESIMASVAKEVKKVLNESNASTDGKEYDEEWRELAKEDKTYKLVDESLKGNNARIHINYVAKVMGDDPHYIACLYGGLNGPGNWFDYLDEIKQIFTKLLERCSYVEIVKLDNDVCDDVWTMWLTFKKKRVNESLEIDLHDRYLLMNDFYGKFTEMLNEAKKKVRKNDKGEKIPEKCPKCGSKIGVFIQGEPIYKCTNKKCGKFFGVLPFHG